MTLYELETHYRAETDALRRELESERTARISAERERDIAKLEIVTLRETVTILSRDLQQLKKVIASALYGRKSERDAEGQGLLAFTPDLFGATVTSLASPVPAPTPVTETATVPSTPRKPRTAIPQHLPREEKIHEKTPEELDQLFGAGQWKEMGVERREELDYRPSSLFVVEHVIKKYAAKDGLSAPVRAEAPKAIIAKGRPGPGLLAHIAVSKYDLHLPLYRLEKVFRREGMPIARSTMCFWMSEVAILLDGIIATLRREILSSGIVRLDDTPVTLLDPEAPKGSRPSFMWPYMSHDRQVVFQWTGSRARAGPEAFLGGFKGYVQGDAASINTGLASKLIEFVACWAHARRRFFKAQDAFPIECAHALALIRALYAVEADAKGRGLAPDAIRALRLEKSAPILAEIKTWAEAQRLVALPSSKLGDALAYTLAHFDALSRYLEDGRLQIDNNDVEQEIRSVAVGRKNWLFFGGERGGPVAATIYSLIANCRFEGINPFEYLRDILSRIPTLTPAAAAELTPRRWKVARVTAEPALASS